MRFLSRPRAPHLLLGCFCAGLGLSLVVRASTLALAIAAGVLAAASVWFGARRTIALGTALLLAGLWWGSARLNQIDQSELAPVAGEAGSALVEVTGPARRSAFAVRVPIRVQRFGSKRMDEPSRLELPRGRAPPQGSLLEVVASVRRPRRAEEGERFDEAAYLRRQGVHVVLVAGGYRIVGHRGGIGGLADALRRSVDRSLAPGLDGERRAVVAGVVLGEDEGLDQELRDDFRASGLYHLLAVSGQNVAYVIAGALLLAWGLGLPRWAGQVAALTSVLAYVAAVGWQPSVVRAGVAGSLASLAWLASRPADRWYALLVGGAVLMAVTPYTLLEPGFQLSFAAVSAIFVAVPRVERRLEGYPLPRRLAAALAVSAACGVVTAPILWLEFGSIPVYSVLGNALAEPVVAPLLGLAFAATLLDPILPAAALALGWLNGWLAAYLALSARLVGGLPHAQVSSGGGVAVLAVGLLVIGLAIRLRPPRGRRVLALAAIAALLGLAWRSAGEEAPLPPPAGLRVTVLDVGQGEAILLQVAQGALLVDEGPPEAEVADQLQALGVSRLAAIVLTHPHRDHVGGAVEILDRFEVGFVLDPLEPTHSSDERAALAEARQEHVRIVPARVGLLFRLGRLRLRVLWPDGSGVESEDPHQHAVVLLATFGSFDILLTADAESDVTLPLHPPAAEVLKVAHHGSSDPGLPELLELVDPRIAVISVGSGNDYGHPTPSTLAALARDPSLDVYRTDADGRVVIETDGRSFQVRTGR
ncbi:MAG TPA: ComEC/Rec2 family competence protein [Gaiellaceae bacterium]|nr:ComEC/Rec2 family competence protein [Gaiellaceae bacterium]